MSNFWFNLNKPIIALAPMAGYTDSAFRLICRELGADAVYSEMISADALCYHNRKTLAMLEFDKKECPIIFQLFGNDPAKFAEAAKIVDKILIKKTKQPAGKFGLDINFGCPAHKITKNGSGASLMNELEKSYEIVRAVCGHTALPVSVKIRSQVKNITALEFVKKIKDLPFSAIMIHGRSLSQGFSGKIDFDLIKKIKRLLPDKIVLANGNINCRQDIAATLKKTGADGVGIARAALGNPWIFNADKTIPSIWSGRQKIILQHARLFLKTNSNLIPLRKHLVHYAKGLNNASALRQQIIRVNTLSELQKIFKQF